jgi:hypothetical protein
VYNSTQLSLGSCPLSLCCNFAMMVFRCNFILKEAMIERSIL